MRRIGVNGMALIVVAIVVAISAGCASSGGSSNGDATGGGTTTNDATGGGATTNGTTDSGATTTDGSSDVTSDLVKAKCTVCHTIDRINEANKDRAAWEQTVARMRAKGAVLTDAEAAQIVDSLSK